MKNKIVISLAAALMSAVLFCGNLTAYANAPGDTTESAEESTSETSGVTTWSEVRTDEAEEATVGVEPERSNGILTPEGNLTMVDNIEGDDSKSLQYMTVKTRNGEIFYMIVDKNGASENVYFLNMVDEKDLVSILSEEDQGEIDALTKPVVEETPQVEEEESGWGTVPYIDNDTAVRGEYTPFEPKEEVDTFSGTAIEGNEEEELQQERIAGGAVGEAKSQVEALHGITDYSEGEYTPVYGD